MLIVWRDDDGDTHDGFGGGDHHKRYPQIEYIDAPKKKKKQKSEEPAAVAEARAESKFQSPILDRDSWIDAEIAAMRQQISDAAALAREVFRLEQLQKYQLLGDLYDRYLAEIRAEYSRGLDEDFFFLLLLSEEDH